MRQILIVLFLLPVLIFGQNVALIEDGKVWDMESYPNHESGKGGFPLTFTGYSYELIGDTLLNDKLYNLVYYRKNWFYTKYLNGDPGTGANLNSPPILIGCIREDLNTQKIFYINWYTQYFMNCWLYDIPINEEILLYDFGIEVGDTMHYDFNTDFQYILESKENFVFENGEESIIYNFESGLKWVEGIGGYDLDYGLLGPLLHIPFEGGCILNCVHVDSIYYMGDEESYCDRRSDLPSSIDDLTNENVIVNIYPIPSSDNLTISIDSESTFSYQIYDLQGNAIWNEKRSNSRIVNEDFSVLARGVYFIKVILKNSKSSCHKFIIN